jgi:hypothetical protein
MADIASYDDARRLWMIALDVARAADHPLGTDQTIFVLYDMALREVHLGHPEEALRLVHLGHAAAACDRALGQASEHFSTYRLGDPQMPR